MTDSLLVPFHAVLQENKPRGYTSLRKDKFDMLKGFGYPPGKVNHPLKESSARDNATCKLRVLSGIVAGEPGV